MTIIKSRSSRERRAVKNALKSNAVLRVLGTEKMGFRLAAEVAPALVIAFGQTFRRQTDAVNFGTRKYGVKAIKVVGEPPVNAMGVKVARTFAA